MKSKKDIVYVIHEVDLETNNTDVIGVASSLENVDKLVDEYYGEDHTVNLFTDIRDSTLEWNKVLTVKSYDGSDYSVSVTVQWFEVDVL